MIKEVLDLSLITDNYYSCNLSKSDDVELNFDNIKLIFSGCLIFKCGYPNEEIYMHYDFYTQESMRKHRLYEILESQWIIELNEMNKVHPRHTDKLFKGERHFLILFEDEVFECIATSYEVVS